MIIKRVLRSLAIRIWNRLPNAWRNSAIGQGFGRLTHRLVSNNASRMHYVGTYFMRNRPELELMRCIVDHAPAQSEVKIAVLGCSKGCEVYSILWVLRTARPDLRYNIFAVDISEEVLNFAHCGVYTEDAVDDPPCEASKPCDADRITRRDQDASIFHRLSGRERDSLFEISAEAVRVKALFREGITWHCGDVNDPKLQGVLGSSDIVVANRFLCHMPPSEAEACLRQIVRLVRPGGFLFVTGVDLDVRSKVALEMGWKPITKLLKEIHEGDPSLRSGWPLNYWGLEPLRTDRDDWQVRYASVFIVNETST